MKPYQLNKLLDVYTDNDFQDHISFKDYNEWIKRHIYFNKPDFVSVLCLKNKDTVIYSENLNLKFGMGRPENMHEISRCVDSKNAEKILEADLKFMSFVKQNKEILKSVILQLRFTANLDGKKPKSYLRNVSFIQRNYQDSYHTLLLVTFSDVTDLLGIQNTPTADIRFEQDPNKDVAIILKNLKKELNLILSGNMSLTARQKDILGLIATGHNSKDISEKLKISINTVNTHRQNIIKKFNVTNTASLIRLMNTF